MFYLFTEESDLGSFPREREREGSKKLHFSFASTGEPELSIPTIGTDQLIYACANNEVVAFRGNGSLALSASMNQTCQTNVAPVIDYNGKVGQYLIQHCVKNNVSLEAC